MCFQYWHYHHSMCFEMFREPPGRVRLLTPRAHHKSFQWVASGPGHLAESRLNIGRHSNFVPGSQTGPEALCWVRKLLGLALRLPTAQARGVGTETSNKLPPVFLSLLHLGPRPKGAQGPSPRPPWTQSIPDNFQLPACRDHRANRRRSLLLATPRPRCSGSFLGPRGTLGALVWPLLGV